MRRKDSQQGLQGVAKASCAAAIGSAAKCLCPECHEQPNAAFIVE